MRQYPALTLAAAPPELPPALLLCSSPSRPPIAGLITGPKCECTLSDPIPNSSQFVLPTIVAPPDLRRDTTVASYDEAKSLSVSEEAVVGISLVQMLSLMDIVQPERGPDALVVASEDVGAARELKQLYASSTPDEARPADRDVEGANSELVFDVPEEVEGRLRLTEVE